MQQYAFIFSNERKYKLQRHLAFWASWWLFCATLYSFSPIGFSAGYGKKLLISGIDALFYLSAHIFLAYTLMYWVVPRFIIGGKYLQAAFATIFLFLITAAISAFIGIYLLNPAWRTVFQGIFPRQPHINWIRFYSALLGGLRGAITIGGLAAAIKLMKHLYIREQSNLQLQKQNVESQLNLLKAQVHPHFLFNTLNNIYAHTQVASPDAPKLVAGLSDMLRYMLYETNQPLVPLDKELKMLQDYIMLEQIRYNSRLDISLDLPTSTAGYQIAPLLLLPLVENCFKHGASQMIEHPWVSLSLAVEDGEMKLKLLNGKSNSFKSSASGIGISNVRQRLELLYPNRHNLRITQTEDAFVVNLKLVLDPAPLQQPRLANTLMYE